MADNLQVIDAQEVVKTLRAKEMTGGVLVPAHAATDSAGNLIDPATSEQIGGLTDAAWDFVVASASLIAIAKAMAVRLAKAATIEDVADVTLNNGAETTLLAQDGARRDAVIVADPTNTVNIRIGNVGTVAAARGAILQPGQAIVLSTTAAIGAFASAAAQKVSVTSVKD